MLPSPEDIEARLASGDVDGALTQSARLLDAHPGDERAIELHSAALSASGNDHAAIALLSAACAQPQAAPRLKEALALCQVSVGDFAQAARNFRSTVDDRPDDFRLRLSFAECLDLAGDAEAAIPEYFRAVRMAQGQGRWLSDATTAPALRERVKRAMGVIDAGRLAWFERALEPQLRAYGRDSLRRVIEALELYLELRPAPPGDPRQKCKFFWMPGLPATPFFDRGRFEWYAALEAATTAIREEVEQVIATRRDVSPFLQLEDNSVENEYLGGDVESRAWDAHFFHRHGQRFDAAHLASPRTSAALELVPLTRIEAHAPEVLFSFLAPHSHIKPHHGVTNTRVVTHLPLIIPPGDCRLVVGGVAHAWQEGRCVTFDDTFLHEAWNRTGQPRTVMLLDTWHPDLAPEECLALRDLIEAIGHFNVRAGVA